MKSHGRIFVMTVYVSLYVWVLLGTSFVLWRGYDPFVTPGDDWTSYAEIARTVAQGDWTGGLAATGSPGGRWWHGTFLYPYLLAPLAFLWPGTWWTRQNLLLFAVVTLGLLLGRQWRRTWPVAVGFGLLYAALPFREW